MCSYDVYFCHFKSFNDDDDDDTDDDVERGKSVLLVCSFGFGLWLHSFHGWIYLRSESWQWVELLSDGHSMLRILVLVVALWISDIDLARIS